MSSETNLSTSPSSAADFLASLLATPEDEQARTITATSGRKCYELYLMSNHPSLSLRTLVGSFLCRTDGLSMKYTTRWRLKTISCSRRLWFQLAPLARDIGEIDFGLWATPRAEYDSGRHRGKADTLHSQVKMLPTPHGMCAKNKRRPGPTGNELGNAVRKLYATPQARDFRTGQAARWANPHRSRNLNDQAGGKLSVIFVEWLMGYPIGWTALEHSGTQSYPKSPSGSGEEL